MITKDEFQNQSLFMRIDTVNLKGDLVAAREADQYQISLYNLNSFLVEVYYHNGEHMIEKIEIVEGNQNLDLYPIG